VARIRPALLVLAAAAGLLAAMLAVNLSSVLLARAAQREHEYAVSRALGANGAAVVRASLLEGVLLGLVGGALGTLLAGWGTRVLLALAPLDLPRRDAIAVDWRIALATVAIGGLLGLVAAVPPSLWAARSSLAALLAAGAVRGGVTAGRMRRGLIVAQVAITLVLLTSGGLVVRSLERLLRADPGFRPEGLLSVRVRVPPEFFPRPEDAASFQERLQATLAGLPGVTAAGAASALPLTAGAFQLELAIPGAPGNSGDAGRDVVAVDMVAARAGFFEAMGMRLVEGRTFGPTRPEGAVREALVDTLLARRFFPGSSPIGALVPFRGSSLTVVGVVEPARLYDVHRDGRPQLYIRPEDWGVRPLLYVARTTRDPRALLPEIESAVRGLDPRVAVGEPRTLEEVVEASLRPQRASALLLSAFAVGALLLAGMGLFGVVAGSVTRRRRELAVRMALGAGHGAVLLLVLGEGALLVAAGALAGAPGVYAAGALVRGVLVGISPWDPATLVGVALGLAAVALFSCYVPARRVVEIDPAQLLRQE
jgi:putative ABC transport system permease protein